METVVTKGPHTFDSTLQTANTWLREIDDRLLCEDRQTAYEALRAVLHVLRDRLPLEAVLGLSAQTPMLIRGLLLEGWRPQDGPSALRDPRAFGDAVADRLPPSFPASGLEAAEAVFGVLGERLDAGEVRKIVAHLPEPLRALWPAPPAARAFADVPPAPAPARHDGRPEGRGGPLRWGLVVGAALAVAGGAVLWVLLAGPVLSAFADPGGPLPDAGGGLRRLAFGLLTVGVIMFAVSAVGAVILRRVRGA